MDDAARHISYAQSRATDVREIFSFLSDVFNRGAEFHLSSAGATGLATLIDNLDSGIDKVQFELDRASEALKAQEAHNA